MKVSDIFSILVQSGILGVLLSLLLSGVRYAKTYLDAKTAEAAANIKDTNIRSAVQSAEDCVTTVVLELSQTTVDDIKAKAADGKLTAAEAQQLQADAVEKVMTLLSTDVYNTIVTIFGDAEAWIKSKIEAAVKRTKPGIQRS